MAATLYFVVAQITDWFDEGCRHPRRVLERPPFDQRPRNALFSSDRFGQSRE